MLSVRQSWKIQWSDRAKVGPAAGPYGPGLARRLAHMGQGWPGSWPGEFLENKLYFGLFSKSFLVNFDFIVGINLIGSEDPNGTEKSTFFTFIESTSNSF